MSRNKPMTGFSSDDLLKFAVSNGMINADEVLEEMGMVVEGIRTTKAAHQMAKAYDVPMPITEALYGVLFENIPTEEAVGHLMGRMKKNEMEDLIDLL